MKSQWRPLHLLITSRKLLFSFWQHIVIFGLVSSTGFIFAQSARDLSLAGVTVPDGGAMFSNPALAHRDFSVGTLTIPVPFGAFGVASSLSDETIDPLYLLDSAFHLESYLFNPASGDLDVDDIGFEARTDEEGQPRLELNLGAGDVSGFVQSLSRGIEGSLDAPLSFRVGAQTFAVHPFANSYVQFTPEGNLDETVSVGVDKVRLNLIAGVSADWLYAGEVGIPHAHFPGAKRYVGIRLAPFVGLANIDADIDSANLTLDTGLLEASYRLNASSFTSLITSDGGGGGLRTDWGILDVVPLSGGASTLSLGFSLQNLSLSYWRGLENDLVGEGSSAAPDEAELEFQGRDTSRFFFSPHLNVLLHGAYTQTFSSATELSVAADLGFDTFTRNLSASLGAESILPTPLTDELALRAGLGWERGLTWGLGTGATWGWFGLDVALHSYQSPASLRSTYGLALSSRISF